MDERALRNGTPGGGSGGAIYQDGNTFSLDVCGSRVASNSAVEGGSAVFHVSNDRSSRLAFRRSMFEDHAASAFETAGYPGFFVLTGPGGMSWVDSVLRR